MAARRRNPLRGHQPTVALALAVLSGLLAALAGLHPTGSTPIDVVLVAFAAAAVTWAAATAPWWAIAIVGLVATFVAAGSAWVCVAIGAVAIASFVGAQRLNWPWARSLATLLLVQVFARQEVGGFLGLSALVGCGSLAALLVFGVWRRQPTVRRRTRSVLLGLGVGALVVLLGLFVAALIARAPLQEGNRQARAGLDALNRGDIETARSSFESASKAFARADGNLSAMWAQPARLLPVFAQHRAGLEHLSQGAASVSAAVASALGNIDPESVRMVNGVIDLDAIRALEQPFTELRAAITKLSAVVDEASSPWLVAPLQQRLESLDVDLRKNAVRADNAVATVRVAPQLLGADGIRRYFIAFTTPAEARGLGGFMGNWAELTVDNGKLSMARFGRTGELNLGGADPTGRRITGPEDFLANWGRFGFVKGDAGTTGQVPWSNVTMPPDFPTVAKVISQLYPQSGGRPIDGVFAMDVNAIAALLTITGPIQVEGVAQAITAENAAQFILKDQYEIADGDGRVDVLDSIARTAVERLLTSSLPEPAELARTFGPLAQAGRLMAWSADADEQDVFARVSMDGAFPELPNGDGVAVVVDNASANKIDAYLDVAVEYRIEPDAADGQQRATAVVTLANNAPQSGLPDVVIGNLVGLPPGSNRMWMSVYTVLPMVSVKVGGEVSSMETGQVFGWNVASRFLDVPPGETVVVQLQLSGTLSVAKRGQVVTRVQPMVVSPVHTITYMAAAT